MIKLKFDEKEYLRLMELVYLGNWVINSAKDEPEKEYEVVESKIFSHAQTAGCSDLADYAEEFKEYFPTAKFDELMSDRIEEYDNNTFWERLIEYMAKNELLEKYKDRKEDFDSMPREKKWTEIDSLEDKYRAEFEKHGIDRLFLNTH
ncbi:MAG: hypothetical protein HY746_06760 [Elusimicrobia bacterium]|nr:hypothetical protein [Elusimicrobiota bacterium]